MTFDKHWVAGALCAQVDVGDVFFPEKGQSSREAKSVCNRCDVQAQCLEYALNRRVIGVWGGTSEREREAIRRRKGIRLPSGWQGRAAT